MRRIIKNKRAHKNSLCNFLPKNRKGDITVTILVIEVFIMCTYALFSFYTYDSKIKKSAMETNAIEQLNSEIEKYYFYKNLGTMTEEQIENLLGVQKETISLPNGETLERKYLFAEKTKDNKKIISVRYYLP